MNGKPEVTEIELPDGKHSISLKEVEQLKDELLTLLEQKEEATFPKSLVEMVRTSPAFITTTGGIVVGGWRLTVHDGHPLLFLQLMPRTEIMVSYEADLTIENGRWRVSDVRYVVSRGLGRP